MTHRERILRAIRGEWPDRLPFAPRLDLWYSANLQSGTLPEEYKNRTPDEIARAQGWALHKINPEYQKARKPEDILHWALGILSSKETVYGFRFPPDVNMEVNRNGGRTEITYHTPVGSVRTTTIYTEEMRKAGVSNFWVEEPVLKGPGDYRAVGYIFENLKLFRDDRDFLKWKEDIGEDGVPFTLAGRAASPMHHIQKYFVDATDFYFHYHDYAREMQALAESMAPFFDRVIQLAGDSPAEVVYWGANFDDMITYPAFFEKDIVPWIRKAADILGRKGKFVSCHCDGENLGLLDLIRDSGMHIAEAVTPAPMTKVPVEEYYRRWSDKLTLFGGIPSILLLQESTTDEEFEAYLDHLFRAIAPGKRMILGIADSTPPKAIFDRLVRIGERVEKEGRLPLEAGAFRPLTRGALPGAAKPASRGIVWDEEFRQVQNDVLEGDHAAILEHIRVLLNKGAKAEDILKRGMLSAMEVISERFKSGEAFIPEVLLSARAMNEAVRVLEPHLAGTRPAAKGKVIIGTVKGDLHDIGKNLVLTMLKGVGFETVDLGTDVTVPAFVRAVEEHNPDILGLSALLTTTMPQMKAVLEGLEQKGLRDKAKVMVGGAPVNEKFARDIGADGYAPDGAEAVTLAKKLMLEKEQEPSPGGGRPQGGRPERE
jgi:corrinoid protein of di/trimethylamine methyltransferase